MREIYMKKSVLLNQLKEAVSREEYEKLMTDTISDISQYNRRTMLEIRTARKLRKEKSLPIRSLLLKIR